MMAFSNLGLEVKLSMLYLFSNLGLEVKLSMLYLSGSLFSPQ